MHLLFIIIFPVLYIRYIFIICFLCSVVLWSMLLINLSPCFYSQHPEQRYGLADVNHSLHQQISYEAALQSLVLLKNDGALPINEGVKIAVVGPHSISRNGLFSDYAASSHCFNGTDACVPTIAEGLAAANQGGSVSAAMGVEINSNKTDGISAALDAVRKSDFVGPGIGRQQKCRDRRIGSSWHGTSWFAGRLCEESIGPGEAHCHCSCQRRSHGNRWSSCIQATDPKYGSLCHCPGFLPKPARGPCSRKDTLWEGKSLGQTATDDVSA